MDRRQSVVPAASQLHNVSLDYKMDWAKIGGSSTVLPAGRLILICPTAVRFVDSGANDAVAGAVGCAIHQDLDWNSETLPYHRQAHSS
ncbi:hypothetical protein PCANC_01334 [Puccinia coronata f. sp. avenae]|uniref:Uncharacterized protein n=1 Tax=Puccinia coronata f. sp. avenae TaxID=200324 RepID=A0A2N5W6E6_9BASI|nr:hypothetical protein PCANC_17876 [Puccinia coronata f. sp. avenae]PLW57793.1 hypothetical protein PCANC_01334 [Puccinia coronata f. sp. avenae]